MGQLVARPASQPDAPGMWSNLFLRVRVLKPIAALAFFAVLLSFQFNQTALAQTTERAVPVVLSPLFDNDGITTANRPTDGNLGGSGYSLPAEHLLHAGLTTIGGVPFLFPGASPGERNNLIANGHRRSTGRNR